MAAVDEVMGETSGSAVGEPDADMEDSLSDVSIELPDPEETRRDLRREMRRRLAAGVIRSSGTTPGRRAPAGPEVVKPPKVTTTE